MRLTGDAHAGPKVALVYRDGGAGVNRWAVAMAPQVGVTPQCCQAYGILATFGEYQVMAQLVATRWLVFPLMKEDFRVCHPLLARGDGASATLNHQNWTRARRC